MVDIRAIHDGFVAASISNAAGGNRTALDVLPRSGVLLGNMPRSLARIDSLLTIVTDQGANELRIGSSREPKMFAQGVPKRLAIPAMDDQTIRALMGDILSADCEATLTSKHVAEVVHDAGAAGTFHVTITPQDDGGLNIVFLRSKPRSASPREVDPSPGYPMVPMVSREVLPNAGGAPLRGAVVDMTDVPLGERLSALLTRAASMGASDVHVAAGEPPTVRVDGVLLQLGDEPPIELAAALPWTEADHDRVQRGLAFDTAFDVDEGVRVRLHVYATSRGLAAAFRLLPREAPSLASLHMPVPIDDLAFCPHGLVLVSGATGSGKSTTLAALAQEALRRRSIFLIALEDPIEFSLHASSQSIVRRRAIGKDVPDFASGLRDALREDPDVMLVGELRDRETINLALTAAETGHLVMGSIHSRSAPSAIERIVDAYPPERQHQIRVQLADSLRAIVAQKLVPRAHGKGRIMVVEVLRVTHGIAALIREGKTAQIGSAIQSGRRDGMIALERSLADRVEAGDIEVDEARAFANDSTLFDIIFRNST